MIYPHMIRDSVSIWTAGMESEGTFVTNMSLVCGSNKKSPCMGLEIIETNHEIALQKILDETLKMRYVPSKRSLKLDTSALGVPIPMMSMRSDSGMTGWFGGRDGIL